MENLAPGHGNTPFEGLTLLRFIQGFATVHRMKLAFGNPERFFQTVDKIDGFFFEFEFNLRSQS
jgi:hypothetical protein